MSALYATIQGCRGEATRCGSKSSGVRASVQSWENSVCTFMDLDENGKPVIQIQIANGSSRYGTTVFRGTVEELKKKLQS